MSKHYYYKLQDINTEETHVTKIIQVGTRPINFEFQWAVASEEQCNMVLRYLVNRASSDPLATASGNFNRTYNWLTYYTNLSSVNLEEWLDSNPELPVSISKLSRDKQLSTLRYYIEEAVGIASIVNQYVETMRWQATVSSVGEGQVSCFVELGGWNRNQDDYYSFRFLSGREYIGRNDLNDLWIEFEVYDE